MATIAKRHSKNIGTRYTAQIRIKRGEENYAESKTFSKKSLAIDWAVKRELELEKPGHLDRILHEGITIRGLIDEYRKDVTSTKSSPFGRSKNSHLNFLINHKIGGKDALRITTGDLIEHIPSRRSDGVTAATANNDLVWLGVVFDYTATILQIPADVRFVDQAKKWCREKKLIARPKRRERRPTFEELRHLQSISRKRHSDLHTQWIWPYGSQSILAEDLVRLPEF